MPDAFLRFMTYNIHAGRDRRGRDSLGRIAETIALLQPDAAGLQEVERAFRARSGFADQPALLAKWLGWDFRFAAAIDLRPGGQGGKFGNAILTPWPILDSWVLPLAGGREPRVALGAVIDLPDGRVNFIVTHLGLAPAERRRQVQAILERAGRLAEPGVIAGDLNAPPGAPELAPLFAACREAQEACGRDDPTFPAGPARIDYIFFPPEWRILQAEAIPSPASDHWPLLADTIRITRNIRVDGHKLDGL